MTNHTSSLKVLYKHKQDLGLGHGYPTRSTNPTIKHHEDIRIDFSRLYLH